MLKNQSHRVIYHKYDYHDNFLPHLSWYRIYHFRCFIINTEPRDHRWRPPFAHAASTTGTIFSFTRLSAAKSASHDYMNVIHASHCRTYYNTKLLQLSASSWLLPLCCLLFSVLTPRLPPPSPRRLIVGVGCFAPATAL